MRHGDGYNPYTIILKHRMLRLVLESRLSIPQNAPLLHIEVPE